MRLGLMGGTFDPIHFGHLFIAEEARLCCGLDEILFFPNNVPPPVLHKSTQADGETRLRLVMLAIADNEFFQASRVELNRSGPSYAIETVLQLQAEYSDAELFYIVGADSMNEVLNWHRGAELFEYCRFIAASRPGFDLQNAKRKLSRKQQERVTWLEVPGLDVASRELRKRVRENQTIRYLVPDAVTQEIRKLQLYRDE